MKMESRVTPVWDILVLKANTARQSKQYALDKVKKIKLQTISRQSKVDTLLKEYQERMRAMQEGSHNSAQAENHRNFIFQLMDIQNRTSTELAGIEAEVTEARKALLITEQECLKADYLAKRNKDNQRSALRTLEARESDAQGMMQFNMK